MLQWDTNKPKQHSELYTWLDTSSLDSCFQIYSLTLFVHLVDAELTGCVAPGVGSA